MTIQWFPGHMAKARRLIQEKLSIIDIVIELLDARIPLSSRNPMIDDILKGKPRIVLLNKSDLADPAVTQSWVHYFEKQGLKTIPVDSSTGNHVKEIVSLSKKLYEEKMAAKQAKGLKQMAVRALIVGIPNAGKSTLINRLAGKKAAATGDRPGVTKGQQWIKVGKDMQLLDTPGILWPKFEDQEVGLRLAATGAIKDEILHSEEIAFFVVRNMLVHYPDRLKERYDISNIPAEIETEFIVQVMEDIGRKKGCLQRGNKVDLEKAAVLFLRDLRTGKLGKISLERP